MADHAKLKVRKKGNTTMNMHHLKALPVKPRRATKRPNCSGSQLFAAGARGRSPRAAWRRAWPR